MAEWYKDWFATDEYLYVYKHRNEKDALELFNLIAKNINIPDKASILDAACGAGRYALLFARNGYNVTGFDLSENLLKIAKQNARCLNINIDLFCTDVRQFCVRKKFDLAVNLFTSFGYFENDDENFLLIRNIFNHLKDKSFFVFDYFNVDYLVKKLPGDSVDFINGAEMIQKRFIDGNRVKKVICIKKDDSIKQYFESVRLYYPDEIRCVFKKFGFEIIKIFGDYSGGEFNNNSSPRLIIFAQK